MGCNKVIELMFKDLSKTYLNKIFILIEVLLKFYKNKNNLLIIVKSLIDSFINYYIQELIHSIRSLNRKLEESFKESALLNYQIK